MKYILCILIGYLIGAINPSYIIGKIRGVDIRQKGSKNAGASNALILFGKVSFGIRIKPLQKRILQKNKSLTTASSTANGTARFLF